FPYPNNPTSKGYNLLIRTRNCENSTTLERLFQDLSYDILNNT
ncbi:hypothetical protein MTR67_002377, partial [Solanum verrucosum]